MRRLVLGFTVLCLMLAGLAAPASAAAGTVKFGPIYAKGYQGAWGFGSVTVSGTSFSYDFKIETTEYVEQCFWLQSRWTGRSTQPSPFSRCGNAAGVGGATMAGSPVPKTIDARLCRGTKSGITASTCSGWTRVYGSAAAKAWGPVRAKKNLASVSGKTTKTAVSAKLVDRTAGARCGWALFTVKAGNKFGHRSYKACGKSKKISFSYKRLQAVSVRVCSGTTKKAAAGTCSKARRIR